MSSDETILKAPVNRELDTWPLDGRLDAHPYYADIHPAYPE